MSSVVIEAHRKHFTLKAPPMHKLSTLVADVLTRLKISDLAPSDCKLTHNGRPLDLETPLRFAALPAGAKLELVTGREQVLGVREEAAKQHQAAIEAAGATGAEEPPPSASTVAGAKPSEPHEAPPEQPVHQKQPTPSPSPPTHQQSPHQPDASSPPSPAPAPEDSHPSVAIFGRRVHIFTRDAELQADSARAADDGWSLVEHPDDFYELNEVDLARVQASKARKAAEAERGLMTKEVSRSRFFLSSFLSSFLLLIPC
jgi:tether containing UBX domain for GLUT4